MAIRLIITAHLILFTSIFSIALAQQEEDVDDIKGKILSLEDCIEIAVEGHPDIRSKRAEVKAGKSRVGQSFSSFLPFLDFSSGYSRSEVNQGHSNALSDSRDNYIIGFSLSQNIFDFGRSLSLWRMSKEEARAISYVLNTTGQDIVFKLEEEYYSHLKALRLEKVNQEAFASAELHLKQARGFYEAGTRPKIDVARAEVDVSNAKVDLIKAENGVRLSKVRLDNAMGLGEPVSYQIKDDLEFKTSDYQIDEILSLAYINRPELLELDAGLKAMSHKIDLCRQEHLPKLTARFYYNWEGESTPLDREWKAGVTLDLPIFSGLDTSYKLSEARDNWRGAKARIGGLKLQIRKEVEQALLSLREAEEMLSATEIAVEQAKENLRLAEGRYEVGLATIIDLTDARVLLLDAETNRIQALCDHKIAGALIERAAGTIPFSISNLELRTEN